MKNTNDGSLDSGIKMVRLRRSQTLQTINNNDKQEVLGEGGLILDFKEYSGLTQDFEWDIFFFILLNFNQGF